MIDKNDEKTIDEVLNEAKENSIDQEGDYDFELWLSSDGKHTVKVTSKTAEGKRKALKVATDTFDYILERYGTKQALSVKEYGNGKKEVKPEECKHTNVKFAESHTEKNPGRWFKSCRDCKAFLGWRD